MTSPAPSNPKVAAFILILNNVAALLANPVLGIHDVSRITALLGLAASAVASVEAGVAELKALDALIKQLLADGRGPTQEEWAAWGERLTSVDARFERIRATLSEE